MADLYDHIGEIDSAIVNAERGLHIASSASYAQGILRASELLSKLYEEHDAERALYYYKLANESQTMLYGAGNVQVLRDMVEEKESQRRELQSAQASFKQRLRLG